MRYWEDFTVGQVERFGAHTVTEDEILAFGRAYDPLPFHTDREAAKDSPYGGLTAPGLLTCSIYMRMLVDHLLNDAASMGSPGVDSIRWPRPVRPGDTLSVRQEVLSARVLESRPDMGLVKNRAEVLDTHGQVVAELHTNGLFRRREA